MDDLPQLLCLLHDARASWDSIATQLGLSQGDVDAIAKKFDDPKDCLREFLKLWLRGVDPKPTRKQLARALQSPPVGRKDIAQQVVPGLPIFPKKIQKNSSLCLKSILLALFILLVLFITVQVVVLYDYSPLPPSKSLSLPVLKHELIGREEEMKVIMGYFRNSEVEVVSLYGQAGFGKSEIALHVGHRMLELGLDVHYIRVENFENVESLEMELMKINSLSYINMRLVNWAKNLTKDTLLILDNVDGHYWVNNTSLKQLKKFFLSPILDNTNHLQVLITSQQEIKIKYFALSYHLHSLSINDCVNLMLNQNPKSEMISYNNESINDLICVCDLVGNVPFVIKVLGKAWYSGTSAKYIRQRLNEKLTKLKFIADKADEVDEDRILRAIEFAFEFIKPECQICSLLLVKFPQGFSLEDAQCIITPDLMKDLNYTQFHFNDCLYELLAKSFLEESQRSFGEYTSGGPYNFHMLIRDYLENFKSKQDFAELLITFWNNSVLCDGIPPIVKLAPTSREDLNAVIKILNHIDIRSLILSSYIATRLHSQKIHSRDLLSRVAQITLATCVSQDFGSASPGPTIHAYVNILDFVKCKKEGYVLYYCMVAIKKVQPKIEQLYSIAKGDNYALRTKVYYDYLIMVKCLEAGSIYSFCDSVWKYNLFFLTNMIVRLYHEQVRKKAIGIAGFERFVAFKQAGFLPVNLFVGDNIGINQGMCSLKVHIENDTTNYGESINSYIFIGLESFYVADYNKAILYLHLALESKSSSSNCRVVHDSIAYIALYAVYSKEDNLQRMKESLAGIRKLDFQHSNITHCRAIYVNIIIPFLQHVDEKKLANDLLCQQPEGDLIPILNDGCASNDILYLISRYISNTEDDSHSKLTALAIYNDYECLKCFGHGICLRE